MPKLPRAILFDLDETIITFGSRAQILAEVAGEFAAQFSPIPPPEAGEILEAHFQAFWSDPVKSQRAHLRLAATRTEIVSSAFDAMRERAPELTPELAQAFGARFHAYREEQGAFFPQALETLAEIRRRGVLMALVTNGAGAPQRAKVERFALAPLFDHVQIEGEHGFGKPEEAAYRHALRALGVEAHEAWMVGDNLEWEVAAPQRLGIFSIWHDHTGEGLPPDSLVKPDRIIRSIAELLDGVEQA